MRALFAVVGFVAFYVITVLTILGLFWFGLACFGWLGDIGNGKVIILVALIGGGCLLASAVLAWSALPRIDRFEPPGPELTETSHPELFAMIRDVAKSTGQCMPVHVYAVLEVNAFVSERGGIMGLGSRRVMGIGLGLLNAFTVDEVRAVIAHEFGHFHGGDTRLGPWVYKTRAAMGRAVVNLNKMLETVSEIEALGLLFSIIEAPFRWMALGYMRLASAVSRAQEFSADAVAARAVGTAPVLSGFRRLAGTAAAVDAYIDSEIATLVGHGVLPPVLAGARQFVEANREQMAAIDADSAKFGEASPFDSHPPLPERIAAIEELAGKVPELVGTADERLGISLLRYPEKLVRELITERVGRPLQAVEWNEVAPHFVRDLHDAIRHHRSWLSRRTVAELERTPQHARELLQHVEGIGPHAYELEDETLMRLLGHLYIAAMAVALEHVGYEARTGPGEPLRFHQGDAVIDPAKIVREYLHGELSEDAWQATWEGAGLHEHPWVDVTWKSAPNAPSAAAEAAA